MPKRMYQPYLNQIQNAITEPNFFLKSSNFSSFTARPDVTNILLENANDLTVDIGLNALKALLGKTQPIKVSSGDHPDFVNLRTTNSVSEKHYIVSVFIDVKNSTSFFRKYNHDQIALIIQTIQSAAIHTCSLFNGHIQRQQYDGLFAYFGGKRFTKQEAIEDALKAVSFFTYFIKYELPEIFGANDLDNIYTRVGIDFGDDKDVSWYIFGVNGCSELTTVSLHTSLVPKMQSFAAHNGVIIGANLISMVPNLSEFATVRVHEGEEKPFIFQNPNYRQYEFNWQNFLLKKYNFIKKVGNNIEIDYEYQANNIFRTRSFDDKVEKLRNNEMSITAIGGLTSGFGHKIAENKFYGHD
jgi:adenylate cyclase